MIPSRTFVLASVAFSGTLLGAAGPAAPKATPPAKHGYQSIAFTHGAPASLVWDARRDALYIADNEDNQLWKWTDAGGLEPLGTLPDPQGAQSAGGTLVGQIVQIADGTLVVARFGKPGGGHGGVVLLNADVGAGGVVPNLDPNRKRLGLTVTADDQLFSAYFQPAAGGGHEGAVTRLDINAGETDFALGFQKIAGVLADGDKLYVSDQDADAIYALPLRAAPPERGHYPVLARLPRPDLLALGPNGSLFTGQFRAAPGATGALAVRQVFPDGRVKVFVQEPDVTQPGGLAYDAKRRRLFVTNGGEPGKRSVRIFPVP